MIHLFASRYEELDKRAVFRLGYIREASSLISPSAGPIVIGTNLGGGNIRWLPQAFKSMYFWFPDFKY